MDERLKVLSQIPIHVCLVSDHLLSNLIPILMDSPSLVYLVVSEDMGRKGLDHRFQKLLKTHSIASVLRDKAPSAGLPELQEYAFNLVAELGTAHPDRTIVLNATGGTKLMALAFVEIFRGLPNVDIIYTDTDHGRLEYLTDPDYPTRPMTSVLDIATYLAAHGLTLRSSSSEDRVWRERVEGRKPLTKWLAHNAADIGDFLGALNGLANAALDRNGQLIQPWQRFSSAPRGRWQKAMEQITPYALLAWDGGANISFKEADSARYLGGLWLEEYAWHIVRDERPDDVQVGVIGTWEGQRQNPSRNEFDLLTVNRNRMLVMECKTLRFGNDDSKDQDILTRLESLGRNAGGLFGRTLLLSARQLSSTARARAISQHIQVIEADRLGELRDFVRSWMNG